MAVDMYMKIWISDSTAAPGIWPIGDSKPELFKLVEFEHRLSAQVSPARPSQLKSGLRSSFCRHGAVRVVRKMDNISPFLFTACAMNERIPALEIYVCQPDNTKNKVEPKPVLNLRLSDVVVADYYYHTAADQLEETIELCYTSIDMKYRIYDFTDEKYKNFSEYGKWNGKANNVSLSGERLDKLPEPDKAFEEKGLL